MYRALVVSSWLLLAAPVVGTAGPEPADARADVGAGARTATRDDPRREPDLVEPNVVGYEEYADPLIAMNRVVFRFNDLTYRYAFVPLGEGWMRVVPEPGRDALGRFFDNLRTPGHAVNHLLQLDPKESARSLVRFVVNSTAGLAGLFDPAGDWLELSANPASFADTLSSYGAGYGLYLVLPFAGPSDARGLVGMVGDVPLSPIPYVLDPIGAAATRGVEGFQDFAPSASRYEDLAAKSEDPYLFFRNLHLQGVQRDAEYD